MPFPLLAPLLIAGFSAAAGALGNRGRTNESAQQSDSNTDSHGSQNSWISDQYNETPTMDPIQGAIRDYLLGQFGNRVKDGTDLSGYAGQGLRQINQGGDARTRAIQNIMASRGLSFSPIAGKTLAAADSERIGQQVNFANTLPLLKRQMQGEDLAAFANFFRSLPTGKSGNSFRAMDSYQENHGAQHGTGTGTNTQPGNILGGALGGGLAALPFLFPNLFPGRNTAPNTGG
jgi:hypothetical protein